jgi:hypothetical protein
MRISFFFFRWRTAFLGSTAAIGREQRHNTKAPTDENVCAILVLVVPRALRAGLLLVDSCNFLDHTATREPAVSWRHNSERFPLLHCRKGVKLPTRSEGFVRRATRLEHVCGRGLSLRQGRG